MNLRIDFNYYPVHVEKDRVFVDIPGRCSYSADTLVDLIDKLQWDFNDVSVPESVFSSNLFVLGDFLKLGFRYLDRQDYSGNNWTCTIKPSGYWSSKAKKLGESAGPRAELRLYQVNCRQTLEHGQTERWTQILTEPELEALLGN